MSENSEQIPGGSFKKAPPGSINNLIVFQKYCDFIAYFEAVVDRFPIKERFSFCSNIKKCLYDTLELFIATNRNKDKLSGWKEIDVKLEILRFYVRRAHEKGSAYLSHKGYEEAAKRLSEIGRMIGGLISDRKNKG